MPATKKPRASASMTMSSMGMFLCDVKREPKVRLSRFAGLKCHQAHRFSRRSNEQSYRNFIKTRSQPVPCGFNVSGSRSSAIPHSFPKRPFMESARPRTVSPPCCQCPGSSAPSCQAATCAAMFMLVAASTKLWQLQTYAAPMRSSSGCTRFHIRPKTYWRARPNLRKEYQRESRRTSIV